MEWALRVEWGHNWALRVEWGHNETPCSWTRRCAWSFVLSKILSPLVTSSVFLLRERERKREREREREREKEREKEQASYPEITIYLQIFLKISKTPKTTSEIWDSHIIYSGAQKFRSTKMEER